MNNVLFSFTKCVFYGVGSNNSFIIFSQQKKSDGNESRDILKEHHYPCDGNFLCLLFCHYRKFVLSIELASKKIFAKLWTLNSMYELYTNNYTISRVRVEDTGTQDANSQLLNQIQIDKLHSSVADPVGSGSF